MSSSLCATSLALSSTKVDELATKLQNISLGGVKKTEEVKKDGLKLEVLEKVSNGKEVWTILERQIPHFNKIGVIINLCPFYIDFSKTGRGKTFIAFFLLQKYFKEMVVIGPVTSKCEWDKASEKTGIRYTDYLSYDSLRGTSSRGVNHKYLDMIGEGDDVEYKVTKTYERLLEKGTLVIFDEAHKVKNTTLVNKSVAAMMRGVNNSPKSRAGFLSGTLFDKEEHATNFLRVFGWIRNKKLVETRGGKTELLGIGEVIAKAKEMDAVKTNSVIEEFNEEFGSITAKNAKKFIFKLFVDVFRDHIASGMTHDIKVEKDAKNGFYKIVDPVERKALKDAVAGLSDCLKRFDDESEKSSDRMASLMRALVELERAKRPLLKRLIMRDLRSSPGTKIFVCVENKETILELVRHINKEFELPIALPLFGEVTPADRNKIIDLFNADGNDVRVLVAQISVGGVGISLHDCVGNHPRIGYFVPRYNFSALVQAVGRTEREGVQSPIKNRFVYAYGVEDDQIPKESSILTAIIKKTAVQKSVNGEGESVNTYPGSYVDEVDDS